MTDAAEGPSGSPPSQASWSSLATLEALYDAYHRQALGLAYGLLGNPEDAEEVVQEAFLAAWRAMDSYNPAKGSTRTWLLSMVRHRAIDLLRARARAPTMSPLADREDVRDSGDVAASALTSVDSEVACRALASLPREQQQVMELVFVSGLSHAEIADRLSIPVGTVKGRIRLALGRLRMAMGIPKIS